MFPRRIRHQIIAKLENEWDEKELKVNIIKYQGYEYFILLIRRK